MKTWLGALVLIGVIVVLWRSGTEHGEQAAPAVGELVESLARTSSGARKATPESPTSSDLIELSRQPRNREATAWLHRSGFTTEYNIHFLNREFLESRAASGDMLAAQMLGYQTIGTPRSFELLTDAARWGSLQALHYLSSASELIAEGKLKEQRQNQASQQDQHEYSIKALEYLFVAEMRGDTFAAPVAIGGLMDRLSFTEKDVSQACHYAATTYAKLEQSRIAEGLPPFDNDPPVGLGFATNYRQHCPR